MENFKETKNKNLFEGIYRKYKNREKIKVDKQNKNRER